MNKPNLFIIGFPKCGTTSLVKSLEAYENIFVPAIKEPNFFNSDFRNFSDISSFHDYENLYKSNNNSNNQKYFVDASTVYIRSMDAVSNILKFNTDAKFIICYRTDLVSMFKSVYNQLYKNGKYKLSLSKINSIYEINHLDYILNICDTKNQIIRALEKIKSNKILFIQMDSLNDKNFMNSKINNFLGFDISKNDYSVNKLNRSISQINNFYLIKIFNFFRMIKYKLGFKTSFNLRPIVDRLNLTLKTEVDISNQVYSEIKKELKKNQLFINKLSNKNL